MNSWSTVYQGKVVPEQGIIIIILLVSVWWRVGEVNSYKSVFIQTKWFQYKCMCY